jgi:hypothetical protein
MKQGGADALSLGGLQTGEDGKILRKRHFSDITNNTQMNSQTNASSSSSNSSSSRGTVVNITFNNCANVTYSTTSPKNT